MKERIAALTVLLTILAVPGFVLWYQWLRIPTHYPPQARVFNITAVREPSGAYTLEEVNGLTYWWKRFSPMTLLLHAGDRVVLNIRSADVSHQFYVPELGIGPVDVRAGYMATVEFTADKAGVYQYFCSTMCGECHCYMTGWIVVSSEQHPYAAPPPVVCPLCYDDFGEPPEGDMVSLGAYLFQRMACVACHGWEGRGGVRNPNYAKKTIPPHNTTAEKLFLRTQED
ncbi:cupredoxin domain-containing protein, partial [Thermodesulfobacteriota bacterium]